MIMHNKSLFMMMCVVTVLIKVLFIHAALVRRLSKTLNSSESKKKMT